MKCISSPALDDTQIVRYVEGEGDVAIAAHIEQCDFCREKVNNWALLQKRLKRNFYRIECPTAFELGDYYLDLLQGSQALVIAQHVRHCPSCQAEIAKLEGFLGQPARSENMMEAGKVLIARMISESTGGFSSAWSSLRGESKGPLTLETDGVVIILDIQAAAEEQINILGQVAAEDQDQWTGAVVEFYQEGKLEFSTMVDDMGAFHSEGIIPGSKELRITTKDHSLSVVSNFELST